MFLGFLLDLQVEPCLQTLKPIIISNSTGDAKVSKDAKHVSLNSVEMCINDAQDNSAAIKSHFRFEYFT